MFALLGCNAKWVLELTAKWNRRTLNFSEIPQNLIYETQQLPEHPTPYGACNQPFARGKLKF